MAQLANEQKNQSEIAEQQAAKDRRNQTTLGIAVVVVLALGIRLSCLFDVFLIS